MARQVTCECGYVVRADDDNGVVAGIRDHMRTDHPELLERVSDGDIRNWIELVD
jgi:predicted small metal-binding protein